MPKTKSLISESVLKNDKNAINQTNIDVRRNFVVFFSKEFVPY